MRPECSRLAQHAGEGAADLEMPEAHGLSVEHRLESGDLLNVHRGHPTDFGDFVHGCQRDPVLVLLHRHLEQWEYGRA